MRFRKALAPITALAFLGLPGATPALAAQPCGRPVVAGGTRARVATKRVGCELGREVATIYYERLSGGDHWDGRGGNGAIFYAIRGFRCFTGLGGTQMFCRSAARLVLASTRPEDRPAGWARPG